MSEAISAFAAYNAGGAASKKKTAKQNSATAAKKGATSNKAAEAKTTAQSRKSVASKSNKESTKSKVDLNDNLVTAEPKVTPRKSNAKSTGKATGSAVKKEAKTPNKPTTANKGSKAASVKSAALKKQSKATASASKAAKTTTKVSASNAKATVKSSARNSKAAENTAANGASKNQRKKVQAKNTNRKSTSKHDSGFDPNDLDRKVEELMGENKKLTPAQKKEKKKLEEYLVNEMKLMGDESMNGYGTGDSSEDEDESDDSDDESDTSDDSNNSESSSDESDDDDLSDDTTGSSDDDDESFSEFTLSYSDSFDTDNRRSNNRPNQRRTISGSAAERNQPPKSAAEKRKSMPETAATTKKSRKSIELNKKDKNNLSIGAHSTLLEEIQSNIGRHGVEIVGLKSEPLSPPANIVKMNSVSEGLKVFRWIIRPLDSDEFFAKYWEKNACLIERRDQRHFSHLISFKSIDEMLLKNHIEFTKNIDITSYENGVRETLNPEGRAMPPVVWDFYGQGCSIRLLNPQTYIPALYTLNTTLQEYFHCMVGANAYLTPPNSQGFAPHYDDIEAFVLQIEGRKRWKLYKHRNRAEILPRISSKNFNQDEIGEPILDVVLQPGDVLYFPRGTIHQACTEPGFHSLHITLSMYQKQSYADLFERMMPLIIERAIARHVDMRRGLPLDTWHNAGIAFSQNDTAERANFMQTTSKLMKKCLLDGPFEEIVDSSVDQLAKKYQHEALPPEIMPSERSRTVFGSRNRTNAKGQCVCDYDIDLTTNVRLLRANIMRLVGEENKLRIYYYLDNSKEYCEFDPNFIEIDPREAGSVEVLIKSYPEYVGVSQLPLDEDEQKIQLVTALWERGLLMMEKSFK